MAFADDDGWPLHDAAAGVALSAAIIGSEWGAPVPLGPLNAAAAPHSMLEEGEEDAPQQPSLEQQLQQAVERLEMAVAGAKGGARQQQPPQGQRGLLRGALAVAGAAPAGPAFGMDEAAVAGFMAAASAALLGEQEQEQAGQPRRVARTMWGRLLLRPSSPPSPPAAAAAASASAAAAAAAAAAAVSAAAPLSSEGEARLVALCGALVAGRDDSPQLLVRSLLRDAVLPHLLALPGAASRPLVSALTGVARRRPVLLLEEVLLPLLCQDGAGVGSAQCEVVTRLVKQGALPPERLDALLLGLCQDRQAGGPALPPGCSCEWTDLTLPVLTAILLVTAPYLPPLGDATVLALLERLEGAVAVGGPLAASLKLAALVNALVGRHSRRLLRFRPLVQRIIDRCEGGQLLVTATASTTDCGAQWRRRQGGASSAMALIVAALTKALEAADRGE